MKWRKREVRGTTIHESDTGHKITEVTVAEGLRYVAWGPSNSKVVENKERYEIGETVPQPNDLLGSFDNGKQAHEACVIDQEKRSGDRL